MKRKKRFNVRRITIIGVLGAISIILGLTPLGFIPIGPTRATIMHIPVIIGGITQGPIVGAMVGLIFGLFSLFQNITNPTVISFAFLNPLVSVLPRVLIGITSYYTYKGFKKMGLKNTRNILYLLWTSIIIYLSYGIYNALASHSYNIWMILINIVLIIIILLIIYFTRKGLKTKSLDIIISAIVGSLTNTVGVLFLIYILFAERFVLALGLNAANTRKAIIGVGITNGIPEAIIAIIIVTTVVNILQKGKN
ncbi:ECF transporter S component [Tissierella creatinophila]|uniref:Pantothenic acid transporter PanT n=1 Tax=Tissierella creatinophila DSM 6911 TaxID=1123403 RepID=A0A1U7M709_TISCR|nr:ECF transporter S component [Tissierella creatinophila]OLS02999.1 pantothenic acid transporter PanT [Tissierella creatinophila DSM 6911]